MWVWRKEPKKKKRERIIKVISEIPLTQMQILSKMCHQAVSALLKCWVCASGRGTPDNKHPLLVSPHSKFLGATEKSPRR